MNHKYNFLIRGLLLGYTLVLVTYDPLFCPLPPPPVLSPLDVAASNATITGAAFTVAGCGLTCLTCLACLSCCWSYQRPPTQVRIEINNDCDVIITALDYLTSAPNARVPDGMPGGIGHEEGRTISFHVPWEAGRDGVTDLTCGLLPWRRPGIFKLAILFAISPRSSAIGAGATKHFLLGVSATRDGAVALSLQEKEGEDVANTRGLMQAQDRRAIFNQMEDKSFWYSRRSLRWSSIGVMTRAEMLHESRMLQISLRPIQVGDESPAARTGDVGRDRHSRTASSSARRHGVGTAGHAAASAYAHVAPSDTAYSGMGAGGGAGSAVSTVARRPSGLPLGE